MNKYSVVVVMMEEKTCRLAETQPALYVSMMSLVDFAATIHEQVFIPRGFFAICVISSGTEVLTFSKDHEGLVATAEGLGNEQ